MSEARAVAMLTAVAKAMAMAMAKAKAKTIRAREDQEDGCGTAGSQASGVGRGHTREKREEWGRSYLAFDEARRGGFYSRVGDMTSILRGERVAREKRVRTDESPAGDRPLGVVRDKQRCPKRRKFY